MNTQSIQLYCGQLFNWFSQSGERELRFPGCGHLLYRSRRAIRRGQLDLAEALVSEGGARAARNAACLNVLGLIAEARGEWAKARRCWSRSARADASYQPPRQNLRRYFELCQFGRSTQSVAFGDEPQFVLQEVLS